MPLRGYKQTKEQKDKIGFANKGVVKTEKHKRKISETLKKIGFKPPINRGDKLSEEHKKKLSEAKMGKNHWNWQGGKSFEPYSIGWTDDLKESIRKRDKYVCNICGVSQDELERKLHVHHIDYDKNNLNPNNLISLCNSCHMKTNHNRYDWITYFK